MGNVRKWSTGLTSCSIIMPAHNEGKDILHILSRINETLTIDFECIIVVDSLEDSTVPIIKKFSKTNKSFRLIVNALGTGPALAIRQGIQFSKSNIVVVTMADASDDVRDIEELVLLVERGVDVACASRYMATGQQIGAPALKSFLSRFAGKSLNFFARVGTKDATNSFKAYNKEFLSRVGIESKFGFEMGIELVAKAHRFGYLIAEIPTIWIERTRGKSQFKLIKWIPRYIKWYLYALKIG